MPGVSGVTVVTMLVCFFYFACEAAGASSARHSLHPLFSGGERFNQNSSTCGEIAELCLKSGVIDLIVIASGAKQSIFDLAMLIHGLRR
jgi:hypothetical protein